MIGAPVAANTLTGANAAKGLTPAVLPLFRELGDLKRIHSAATPGSIAERLFVAAWAALVRGDAAGSVMARTVAAALVSARLGDIDAAALALLGISDEASAILGRAFDEIAPELPAALSAQLREALIGGRPEAGPVPAFVGKLSRQPRAGVTCPGRPRILLQPPENHAEHCLMVAVYGVLASGWHDADPTAVFVAGLAHHLHNADMPDSGYSGEMLLGGALNAAIANARASALGELDDRLRPIVEAAIEPIGGDRTPEARAFHVADVLDRVLEIEQFTRAARLTMDVVLDDYGLVHDGPVKAFHDRILADAGLA
ncbi:HD domain-containing protein [Sphingomonas sp. TZW2008]|uniref:HD domain-containing protein n=1 Tax=Sphingomonas sp. TZW2008 TaxID=1917973 RepID=UPI00211A1E63|nr:HD domain-containing protein [Sphingomonas sp. TZW2008]